METRNTRIERMCLFVLREDVRKNHSIVEFCLAIECISVYICMSIRSTHGFCVYRSRTRRSHTVLLL